MIYIELQLYASLVTRKYRKNRSEEQKPIPGRDILGLSHSGAVRGYFNRMASRVAKYIFPKINQHNSYWRRNSDRVTDVPLNLLFHNRPQNSHFMRTYDAIHNKNAKRKPNKPVKIAGKYCNQKLEIYNNDAILLKDAIFFTNKITSKMKGGEELEQVIGQSEHDELVSINKGFLKLPCILFPPNRFPRVSDIHHWYQALQRFKENETEIEEEYQNVETTIKQFTIFIRRGDYANLYWGLCELYSVYMTVKLFNQHPNNTLVIFMDAHPKGKLDMIWNILFKNVIRVAHIKSKTILFKQLTWTLKRGPIAQNLPSIPYVLDFKNDIMNPVVNKSEPVQICNDGDGYLPVVTLILRRDYLAHPRNREGKIKRKIANEKQLIDHLNKSLKNFTLNAVQIDTLELKSQLQLIHRTSILIGVHGAGLGFGMLLPTGAAVIELFPSSYRGAPNNHFRQFAIYGGGHYTSWYSRDKGDEFVHVPPTLAEGLIRESYIKICG